MRAEGRRGSTAIEFALTLPVLLILVAGVVDLGQYLYISDALAAAVSEGARAGALADAENGENALDVARTTAEEWWVVAELPGALGTVASFAGDAPPNERLILTGTVPSGSQFLILDLPVTVSYTHTIRLFHQP